MTKVRRYEPHPITRDFNFVTLFVRARPVMIASDSTVAGLDARYLAVTDDASWGEVDESSFAKGRAARDGDDLAGPLPIAAAAKRTPMVASGSGVGAGIASRVVLIGDSDFAGNAMLGVLGNTDANANDLAAQTREVMTRSARTLTSAGMTFADVVDNTIYMTDIWQASAAHKVYAELLGADAPARTTVGTGLVVRNGLIEMMMTAVR